MTNPLGIDWDDIIAAKVADKVLDKIGDQLKMPPRMAEVLADNLGQWESQMTLPGHGPGGLSIHFTYDNTHVRITFNSMSGERLMSVDFHK